MPLMNDVSSLVGLISNLNMAAVDLYYSLRCIHFDAEKYLPLEKILSQADEALYVLNPTDHNYSPDRLASFRTALGLNNTTKHNQIAALVIQIETTAPDENIADSTLENMIHRGMILLKDDTLARLNKLEHSVRDLQANIKAIQSMVAAIARHLNIPLP